MPNPPAPSSTPSSDSGEHVARPQAFLAPPTAGASRRDGTTLLTVYVVLLIAIPSRLVFAPLGGAGTPAQIVGMLGALWWFWDRVRRSESRLGPREPVKLAMFAFAWCVCVSFVAAMVRPLSPEEFSTASLGLAGLAGWAGVLLVASDGVPTVDRLVTLFTRISTMGGLLAAFGIVQFFTHEAWTEYLSIPGLSMNQQLDSVLGRDGFSRPAGTATHPIEFGVVLTMILPVALTCAMNLRDSAPIRRWLPVAAIAFAIPLSISRSAIVGAAVGLAVIVPTWPRRARWAALGSIAALLTVIFIGVPGILGTISGLFTGIASDSSAQSRVTAYGVAWEFIRRSPVIGRGFSTFLPRYWILDNQYLGLLIEVGVLGLAAMVILLGTGVWAGWTARRRTPDARLRATGAAVAASVLCGAIGLALYDTLGFAMSAGTLMLMLGLAGATLNLARSTAAAARARDPGDGPSRIERNHSGQQLVSATSPKNHPFAAEGPTPRR